MFNRDLIFKINNKINLKTNRNRLLKIIIDLLLP